MLSFFPPAIYSTGESGKKKEEKTNYLAHRCVIFHYVFQLKKKTIPLSQWLPRIRSTTEQTISQQLGFTVETSRIQLHR